MEDSQLPGAALLQRYATGFWRSHYTKKALANGGLILLPDLVRFWLARREHGIRNVDALVRLHYLLSPATCSIGVLTLLIYPLDLTFSVAWLPLATAPYFYLYGRDLIRSGYRWSDLLRVYALNLILLPVNLAGVLLSLRQIITGRKSSFGRTPKIEDRTAVPPLYHGFDALMFMIMALLSAYAIASENYGRALFRLINVVFYTYGLVALIGLRESWEDVKLIIRRLAGRRDLKMFALPLPQSLFYDERAEARSSSIQTSDT